MLEYYSFHLVFIYTKVNINTRTAGIKNWTETWPQDFVTKDEPEKIKIFCGNKAQKKNFLHTMKSRCERCMEWKKKKEKITIINCSNQFDGEVIYER